MKVLVFGANGFIGKEVARAFGAKGDLVVCATRNGDGDVMVDLANSSDVARIIGEVSPDTIVNCAGVISVDADIHVNRRILQSILEGVLATERHSRVITIGSAASYGIVEGHHEDDPIQEETPLRAVSGYGLSKKLEEDFCMLFSRRHGLDVVVLRLFNCIGPGLKGRQLIPGLIRQIQEYRQNERSYVEVSRIDAKRDYVDVRDVARLVYKLASVSTHQYQVYNLGSGQATSTGDIYKVLAHQILGDISLPEIVNLSQSPEPRLASRADIHRIEAEFGWAPSLSLDQSIKDSISNEEQ